MRRLRRWLRFRARRAGAWLWRRLMLRTTVIAITGSIGKTTTGECLAAILSAHAPTHATRNNENDSFGVPRTLLRMRPWQRFAVIEVAAGDPGGTRPYARLVRPDVAIVLALAPTHTDLFPDLDAIAARRPSSSRRSVRDEMNSSPDTWRAALEVLRNASARRRLLVASDLSDSGLRPRARYRALGDFASEAADAALFIGEHARYAVKRAVERGVDPGSVHGVLDVRAAAERLASLLQEGDVALLKGRATSHLSRVLFAQLGTIGCWKTRCRKRIACDGCAELRPAFDLRAAIGAG